MFLFAFLRAVSESLYQKSITCFQKCQKRILIVRSGVIYNMLLLAVAFELIGKANVAAFHVLFD